MYALIFTKYTFAIDRKHKIEFLSATSEGRRTVAMVLEMGRKNEKKANP